MEPVARATLTLIGNEGFRVRTGVADIFIDAFNRAIPEDAWRRAALPDEARAALILVTHAHWDHFDSRQVVEAARMLKARVIGPRSVVGQLEKRLARDTLVEMEPPLAEGARPFHSVSVRLATVAVTAYRTCHSRDHNSYLVETSEFRFFHDGDNEDTRRIDVQGLGRLDALLIGPWQGAGWVEFIEKLAPTRYFLMHLTDEELADHARGRFLPEICDRVPPGLVVLRPGEVFVYR